MTDFERVTVVKNMVGKSFNAICDEIGINRNTFSDIKNQKCGISEKVARKLQEFYGISETWLLTGRGEIMKNPANVINNSGDFATNTINGDLGLQLTQLMAMQRGLQQDFTALMREKDKQIAALIEIINKKENGEDNKQKAD